MRWPICFSATLRVIQSRRTPFSPHLSYTDMGYYMQDDWRLTDSLTANVGLRWEYFGRPVERDDRIASFDLATGQQVFPGQNGYPRSLVDPYYKDFAPRLGLAWRAGNRTALRGGYGMFYTPDVINTYRQLAFQEPFGGISSLTARPADPQNPLPVFTVEDPLTQATRLTTNNRNGMQRDLRDGQVQQWTCVRPVSPHEHDVARSGLSRFQERAPDGRSQLQRNRPVPGSTAGFCARSSIPAAGQRQYLRVTRGRKYTAVQARLERRLANGFTGLVSYTFQQTLTDLDVSSAGVAVGAGAGLQTIKDIRANWGPAPFDRPHRLVVSWLYELPFFKNRR